MTMPRAPLLLASAPATPLRTVVVLGKVMRVAHDTSGQAAQPLELPKSDTRLRAAAAAAVDRRVRGCCKAVAVLGR